MRSEFAAGFGVCFTVLVSAVLVSTVLFSCGCATQRTSTGNSTTVTVPEEPPAVRAYDLEAPAFETEEDIAAGFLLMRLSTDSELSERLTNAVGSALGLAENGTCDPSCRAGIIESLRRSESRLVQIAIGDAPPTPETDAEREFAAVARVVFGITYRMTVMNFDFHPEQQATMISPQVCGRELSGDDLNAQLLACAGDRFRNRPLFSWGPAAIQARLLDEVHQGVLTIREGGTALSATLQAGFLDNLLEQVPILGFHPSAAGFSDSPMVFPGEIPAQYDALWAGYVAHLSPGRVELGELPIVHLGDAVPAWELQEATATAEGTATADGTATEEHTAEVWNAWKERAQRNVENDSDDDTPLSETPEANPTSLASCAPESSARPVPGWLTLVVDEGVSASEILEVLRQAASYRSNITWLGTSADGSAATINFRVAPTTESREDCSAHLNMSDAQSLLRSIVSLGERELVLAPLSD